MSDSPLADGPLSPWYSARDHVRQALEADLMSGPESEVITEPPLDRFIVGILHPQDGGTLESEPDDPENADSSDPEYEFNPAVALSRVRYPSSVGLTFAVDPNVTPVVTIAVSAAAYEPIQGSELSAKADAGTWRRRSVEAGPVEVVTSNPWTHREELAEGLSLHWVVRGAVGGTASVTVVLVNDHRSLPTKNDHLCWFAPQIRVECRSGAFVSRPASAVEALSDDDVASYSLLFRNVPNLAVGHGCAVDWVDAAEVRELRTTFMPHHDVPTSEPGHALGLGMQALGESGDLTGLKNLTDAYREWITYQEDRIPSLDVRLRPIAAAHLKNAAKALRRMNAGIELLEADLDAMAAFRLMNRAMTQQRVHQEWIRSGERRAGLEPLQNWRPFQIAFILINLPGLVDPDSEDREIADVLWFPTGGGKTEAYLGLIGFAILMRRIKNPRASGVSALMRYTLRLLTIQQFERAAGLICALEELRRRELPDSAPISIGLWVGQGATPNSVDDARAALRSLERGAESESGNPMQLLRCPWCGARLSFPEYRILSAPPRLSIRCADAECEFGDALPVHLIDEDVYRERPSLLLGTVDKFAMMSWRGEVGAFFWGDDGPESPDLIVQDELHLISGPLGTMVGLYECALDMALGQDMPAKVVASTATIRRAAGQIRAVFDRRSEQFPPLGIDASDSFFSLQADPQSKASRQYVGVLAPGVSQTTLLVRAYAALLQAGKDLDVDDEVRDAYWTLVGYFNSLRVLGGAFIQVMDDVPDRLKVIAERASTEARQIGEPHELTSRKTSSEIPIELDALATSWPDPQSPDVVLATNMISVGVDVDRLGLMAVMGQPQTTSEYIQATSRVGRQHPGLVVVLYNAARSRDLSHYESFPTYHRSLYRQVEATGATPFAARARDRGLHGVLVAAARMLIPAAAPDRAAGGVSQWESQLHELSVRILERVGRISEPELEATKRQLEALIQEWADWAENAGPKAHYAGWRDAIGALLMDPSRVHDTEQVTFPVSEPPWPTLTSLRDVDAESWLYLIPPKRGN